jgi:hypothetical protein
MQILTVLLIFHQLKQNIYEQCVIFNNPFHSLLKSLVIWNLIYDLLCENKLMYHENWSLYNDIHRLFIFDLLQLLI